jgi:hypothetical protein
VGSGAGLDGMQKTRKSFIFSTRKSYIFSNGPGRSVFVAQIDDEEHLLFSCESAKDIRLRFAGLPMSSLRDLMQCEDVGSVAWFVHESMERVDNSHAGLSRGQQCVNLTMFVTPAVLRAFAALRARRLRSALSPPMTHWQVWYVSFHT